MKTYLEEHSDATRIFPWLADASSSIRCLCVVGEMLLFPEDIVQFQQTSSEMFRDELKQKHALSTYRFYVVVCVGNKFIPKESLIITSCGVCSNEKRRSMASPPEWKYRFKWAKNRTTLGLLNLVSNSSQQLSR